MRGTRAAGAGPGRPAGCGRTSAEKLPLFTRLWATPVYRLLDDPDGRPLRLRLQARVLSRGWRSLPTVPALGSGT